MNKKTVGAGLVAWVLTVISNPVFADFSYDESAPKSAIVVIDTAEKAPNEIAATCPTGDCPAGNNCPSVEVVAQHPGAYENCKGYVQSSDRTREDNAPKH